MAGLPAAAWWLDYLLRPSARLLLKRTLRLIYRVYHTKEVESHTVYQIQGVPCNRVSQIVYKMAQNIRFPLDTVQ